MAKKKKNTNIALKATATKAEVSSRAILKSLSFPWNAPPSEGNIYFDFESTPQEVTVWVGTDENASDNSRKRTFEFEAIMGGVPTDVHTKAYLHIEQKAAEYEFVFTLDDLGWRGSNVIPASGGTFPLTAYWQVKLGSNIIEEEVHSKNITVSRISSKEPYLDIQDGSLNLIAEQYTNTRRASKITIKAYREYRGITRESEPKTYWYDCNALTLIPQSVDNPHFSPWELCPVTIDAKHEDYKRRRLDVFMRGWAYDSPSTLVVDYYSGGSKVNLYMGYAGKLYDPSSTLQDVNPNTLDHDKYPVKIGGNWTFLLDSIKVLSKKPGWDGPYKSNLDPDSNFEGVHPHKIFFSHTNTDLVPEQDAQEGVTNYPDQTPVMEGSLEEDVLVWEATTQVYMTKGQSPIPDPEGQYFVLEVHVHKPRIEYPVATFGDTKAEYTGGSPLPTKAPSMDSDKKNQILVHPVIHAEELKVTL